MYPADAEDLLYEGSVYTKEAYTVVNIYTKMCSFKFKLEKHMNYWIVFSCLLRHTENLGFSSLHREKIDFHRL